MPLELVGPSCARRGCGRPEWKDGLCSRCWRFGKVFDKPPQLLAYEPLDGYRDERDSIGLPWEDWEQEARENGTTLAELLSQRPPGRAA